LWNPTGVQPQCLLLLLLWAQTGRIAVIQRRRAWRELEQEQE
jgi:hypothetical protein